MMSAGMKLCICTWCLQLIWLLNHSACHPSNWTVSSHGRFSGTSSSWMGICSKAWEVHRSHCWYPCQHQPGAHERVAWVLYRLGDACTPCQQNMQRISPRSYARHRPHKERQAAEYLRGALVLQLVSRHAMVNVISRWLACQSCRPSEALQIERHRPKVDAIHKRCKNYF